MSIITHEAIATSTAEEVCAGKITRHETTTGMRIGQVPSRQIRRCGTAFPGLLVLGLALLITCQALLHVMVTVNLIPETGQTLPLISRGGSSTLFTTIALGMILSVSRQNDEQSHDTPRSESIYER